MRRDQANRFVVGHRQLLERPNLSLSETGYKRALVPQEAFSSEVDSGSREENASKQKIRGMAKGLAAAASPSYKHRQPSLFLKFPEDSHAAKPRAPDELRAVSL